MIFYSEKTMIKIPPPMMVFETFFLNEKNLLHIFKKQNKLFEMKENKKLI